MTTETTNSTPTAETAPQYTPERVNVGSPRTSVSVEFTKDAPAAPQPQEAPKAEEMILGKFKTQDDLAAAYKELEKKLGQPKEEAKPAEPKAEEPKVEEPKAEEAKPAEGDTPKEEAKPEEPKAGEIKDEAGKTIDVPRYEQEFLEKGSLTEESYQELASKHNLPKDIVDDFIAMRLNKAESIKTEFFKAAGGEENLNAMLEWARESTTDGKIGAAYDAALDRAKTPEDFAFAISGLRAQYEAARGLKPSRVVGSESSAQGATSGETFATEAEWKAVLRSDKYKKDGTYRQQVNQRAMNSSWFTVEA
jgi:hypothetical protein